MCGCIIILAYSHQSVCVTLEGSIKAENTAKAVENHSCHMHPCVEKINGVIIKSNSVSGKDSIAGGHLSPENMERISPLKNSSQSVYYLKYYRSRSEEWLVVVVLI